MAAAISNMSQTMCPLVPFINEEPYEFDKLIQPQCTLVQQRLMQFLEN